MRDINALCGQIINQIILDKGIQKKKVLAEAGVASATFFDFLSGKTNTSLDRFDRILQAVGIDLPTVLQHSMSEDLPSAEPADFLNLAMVGNVEAGTTNGTVDIEIHDEDLLHWEGPVISVARDLLKKGLRGQSLKDIVALTIHGDSMMPVFQEGDHVFLKKMHDINHIRHKDIVVMDTDGQGSYTIKMWDKAGVLVPLNPKHDVIPLSQCPGARLYGRAVGLERVF